MHNFWSWIKDNPEESARAQKYFWYALSGWESQTDQGMDMALLTTHQTRKYEELYVEAWEKPILEQAHIILIYIRISVSFLNPISKVGNTYAVVWA